MNKYFKSVDAVRERERERELYLTKISFINNVKEMKNTKIDYMVKTIIKEIVVLTNNLSFLCFKKVKRIKDKYA